MMRLLLIVSPLAWRNLWRRRGRTAMTMAAVAIAVGSLIVLSSFLQAWSQSAFDRAVESLTAHGQIHAPGFLEDPTVTHAMDPPNGQLNKALAAPAIKAWAPRVVIPALIRSERESAPITLYGIDPQREAQVSFLNSDVIEGNSIASEDGPGLVIGRLLADRLQVKLNHRVVISAQDVDGNIAEIGVRVIGFFKTQPDLQKQVVFLSIEKAQAFLGLGDKISEIAYLARQRDQIDAVTASLAKAAPDLDIQRWDQLRPFTLAIINLAESTNDIWVFVSFALVAFGLVNTLMLAVFERMREFGLMQALGMKPAYLLFQVLLESIYLVTFGTVAGALIGSSIVRIFKGGLNLGALGMSGAMFGTGQTLYPKLHFGEILFSCAIVIVLSIFASMFPAIRATRHVPVDVLARAQT